MRPIFFMVVLSLLCAALQPRAFCADFKPEQYQEVDAKELKAFPDNYKNKDVCYKTVYRGFKTNFPDYIERSGFKSGKYYDVTVFPSDVIVLGKIKGFLDTKIMDMKNGARVKVYGKIKKFNNPPIYKGFPKYYLELDEIEPLKKDDKVDVPDDEEDDGKKVRKVRPFARD